MEPLRDVPTAMLEERKSVTALFADLVTWSARCRRSRAGCRDSWRRDPSVRRAASDEPALTQRAEHASGGPARSPGRATLLGLLLVGLSLRPQVIAIGPLLPEIRADLGMAFAVAGLLSSIPVLCMGLFAPLGPAVARTLGMPRAMAACVLAIVGFGVLRAMAPGAEAAIALTFGIGIGMGVAGPILPMIVHVVAPRHPGVATGVYATGIVLGALFAAAAALPLAVLGGWRGALAVLSLASLLSLAGWLLLLAPTRPVPSAPAADPPRLTWRRPRAWLLGALFGLQSTLFFGAQTWLANVYVERGWTTVAAGSLVVLYNAAGVLGTIAVPVFADRIGSRSAQLSLAALLSLAGCGGVAAGLADPWVWVVLLAVGTGATFPIVLTLPVDASDRPEEVGSTAAFMLLVGYAISSVAPVALGLARDVSGAFGVSVWILVAVAATLLAAAWFGTPGRRPSAGVS